MQAVRRTFFSEHKRLPEWIVLKKNCSTALVPVNELVEKRNYLFSQEQKKQLEEVGRIEKISVEVVGPPEDITLAMNQHISTPFDCCRHISQGLCQQTPLALINDKILWDMHRPLPSNCKLRFLNFKDEDVFSLNKAFWRTGSLILGAIASRSFKDEVKVHLHSFPPPVVKSGSFVYDTIMNIIWEPTPEELKVLSAEFLTFCHQNLPIEQLKVKKSLALEMFEGQPIKQMQIPQIASGNEDSLITVYRVGDHIDMSCGPMVANTSFFGRCAIPAVHRICSETQEFYRFQGVALPKGIMLNSRAFDILVRRAERLNEADPPGLKDPRNNFYGKSKVLSPNSQVDIPPQFSQIGLPRDI